MNLDVLKKLKPFLSDQTDVEIDVNKDCGHLELRKDLEIDSLGAIDMIMDLEDKFEISVEENEAFGLITLRDLVNLIDNKIQVAA